MADASKTEATQADIARRALELKTQAGTPDHPQAGRTPNTGINLNDGSSIAPSGALGAEGDLPARVRSGHRG